MNNLPITAKYCEYMKSLLLAFTHGFNLRVKLLVVFLISKLFLVTCSLCLISAMDFGFGQDLSINTIVTGYLKEKIPETLFIMFMSQRRLQQLVVSRFFLVYVTYYSAVFQRA